MSIIHFSTVLAVFLAIVPAITGAVDVTVKGRVMPGACVMAFADNGVVNFGVIPASSLSTHNSTPLSARRIELSVDCVQPTKVILKISDERGDSMIPNLVGPGVSEQQAFGLGTSGQFKIGNYYLLMPSDALYVDERRAELLYSIDGHKSWRRTGPSGELHRDRSFSWTFPETRLPVSLKTLRGTVNVTLDINRATELPTTHDINLDGRASFELQYI